VLCLFLVLLSHISINISWMRVHVHTYVRLRSSVADHRSGGLSNCHVAWSHLASLTGDHESEHSEHKSRTRRRKQGDEEGVLTVFLNEDAEPVPTRSDAVLAGVSSQEFLPRNDISGFYPHRVMPHNVHNEARHRASPAFDFSDFLGSSRSWWTDHRL